MACSILYPNGGGADVKFQASPEGIEFYEVSSSFPGLELVLSETLSRRSELKTILPFIITLQRQIIPGQADIFLTFSQGASGLFANFPLKTKLNIQDFTSVPLCGSFFGIAQCTLQIYTKQAMTTSNLYTKYCGSLINACGLPFVWFSFVLVWPKQRKTRMAEMDLGEVILRCDF